MKAILLPNSNFIKDEDFFLAVRDHHHLVNVLRVKSDEDILILKGDGEATLSKIISISKKEIHLKCIKKDFSPKRFNIDLYLGLPKKDAFESCIRIATESGISKVQPMFTDYAQTQKINNQRLDTIIEGSMIQSNNYWKPEILESVEFSKCIEQLKKYSQIFCLSLEQVELEQYSPTNFTNEDDIAFLVGPEGGFSKAELKLLSSLDNAAFVTLPTNILKTPNATSLGLGFILGKYLI